MMMMIPTGLIVLIVLAILCAVLGGIYAYIYFTRINPRSRRIRKYIDPPATDEEALGSLPSTSTHVFLFRKN